MIISKAVCAVLSDYITHNTLSYQTTSLTFTLNLPLVKALVN